MSTVPNALIDRAKIKAAVKRVEKALAPDVVYILYSLTVDWTGEESLFFRVLISDKASAPDRLGEATERIRERLVREIKADKLGLRTYFNFRSKSEQEALREPFWERT